MLRLFPTAGRLNGGTQVGPGRGRQGQVSLPATPPPATAPAPAPPGSPFPGKGSLSQAPASGVFLSPRAGFRTWKCGTETRADRVVCGGAWAGASVQQGHVVGCLASGHEHFITAVPRTRAIACIFVICPICVPSVWLLI